MIVQVEAISESSSISLKEAMADEGCSHLTDGGKIRIKHGSISKLVSTGFKLDDGDILESDEMILTTGYLFIRE